jgi:hypothetical protein
MRAVIALLWLASAATAEVKPMVVRKVIKQQLPEIGACFEKHGDVAARVDVDFVIRKDGRTAGVAATGEGNADLRACIAGVFKRMQFPTSSTETKVHYPVHIITAGG